MAENDNVSGEQRGPLAEYQRRIASGDLKPGDKFQVCNGLVHPDSLSEPTLFVVPSIERKQGLFKIADRLSSRLFRLGISSTSASSLSSFLSKSLVFRDQEDALRALQALYDVLYSTSEEVGLEKASWESRNGSRYAFKD